MNPLYMNTKQFNMQTVEHEAAQAEHAKMLIQEEMERRERTASIGPSGQNSTRNARKSKSNATTVDMTKLSLKPKPIHVNLDFKSIRGNQAKQDPNLLYVSN